MLCKTFNKKKISKKILYKHVTSSRKGVKLYFSVYHSGTVFLEPSTSVIFFWKKSSFFQLFSKKKKEESNWKTEFWNVKFDVRTYKFGTLQKMYMHTYLGTEVPRPKRGHKKWNIYATFLRFYPVIWKLTPSTRGSQGWG